MESCIKEAQSSSSAHLSLLCRYNLISKWGTFEHTIDHIYIFGTDNTTRTLRYFLRLLNVMKSFLPAILIPSFALPSHPSTCLHVCLHCLLYTSTLLQGFSKTQINNGKSICSVQRWRECLSTSTSKIGGEGNPPTVPT